MKGERRGEGSGERSGERDTQPRRGSTHRRVWAFCRLLWHMSAYSIKELVSAVRLQGKACCFLAL